MTGSMIRDYTECEYRELILFKHRCWHPKSKWCLCENAFEMCQCAGHFPDPSPQHTGGQA